ncbi:MAG: DNA-3-methyladenine glycosylase 2 family protein [Clostridia bacterium]|nr:DNA-3-methyladenine glycosylase 2 family protein [Clostridia bacterium]
MRITENFIGEYPFVKIEGVTDFDIGKIFDCGQCFRFDAVAKTLHQKEFSGVAYGRFVSFAQDGDTVFIYGSDMADFENIWRRYLDLDRDYAGVTADILSNCQNPALIAAVDYGRGIRILSQDPFECIISFIISQNNNIPRIKKIIESLSLKCGEPILLCDEAKKHLSGVSSLCAFPSAEALSELGIDGLNELKTGFRSKYIYDAVCRTLDGRLSLEDIRSERDIERSIELLCEVKGIGNKVASCALLFGFEKYNAFPIDVWMKRVAEKYFSELGDTLSWKTFGEYAGIAQQYLFYYERWNNNAINA